MRPKLTNEAWDQIVQDAFSSGAPEPHFSDHYCARRHEMEEKLAMKEDRRNVFQPGLVLATVAALAFAAVPAGLIWMLSRNPVPVARPDFQPGAAVTAEDSSDAENRQDEEPITKDEIYQRSLDTLPHLNQISGDVTIRNGCNSPIITSGHFAYDFRNGVYQSRVNFAQADAPDVTIQENLYYTSGSHVDAFYAYSDANYPNSYVSEDFENGGSNDPTYAHELGVCYNPTEMTIGYLEDYEKWEIVGTEERNGRNCVIVEGSSEEYGSRFGVSSFRICIDAETGVWVQYEGFDETGELQDYLYTQNLRFSDDAEQPTQLTGEEKARLLAEGNYSSVSVPDVTSYHYEYAKKVLEQDGFQIDLKFEPTEDIDAGKVIRTEPAAGTAFTSGKTVILYVSQGQVSTDVTMESYTGMTQEQARLLLEFYGFVVEFVTEPSEEPSGTVIAQSIAAGTVVPAGTTVKLTISE